MWFIAIVEKPFAVRQATRCKTCLGGVENPPKPYCVDRTSAARRWSIQRICLDVRHGGPASAVGDRWIPPSRKRIGPDCALPPTVVEFFLNRSQWVRSAAVVLVQAQI